MATPLTARPRVSAIITTFNEEPTSPAASSRSSGATTSSWWTPSRPTVPPRSYSGYEKVRFHQRTYYGSAAQKNWAMDQVTNEWILIFDADERCTPALQKEIEALLAAGPTHEAYTIRRRVYFLGHLIRFSGWQHDQVVRLIKNGSARYPNRRVHADMITRGPAPLLRNPMDHYMTDSFDDYVRRIEKYSFWGASQNWREKKKSGPLQVFGRSVWRFLRTYVFQLGSPRRHARPRLLHAPGVRHLPEMGLPLGLARQRRPRPHARPPHLRRQRRDLARARRDGQAGVGRMRGLGRVGYHPTP